MQAIVIAIIGSSAFTVVINAIVELIKTVYSKKSGQAKAINFCLLASLQIYGERLIDRQMATREELSQFNEMLDLYKKQGGNGYAEKLKSEVDKLPLQYR